MSPITPLLFLLLLSSAVYEAAPLPLRPGFYSETCPEAENIVRAVLRQAMARETRSAASVMRLQFHDCLVNGCDGSLLLDDTADMVGEKSALSNINSLRSYEVIDEIKEALEGACPGVVSCADSGGARNYFSGRLTERQLNTLYFFRVQLKINNVYSKMSCYREIMKVQGDNTYNIPHMNKEGLDRLGLLPDCIEVEEKLVKSGGPDWEVKLGRLDSLTASQEDSNDIMPSPRANASSLTTLFSKFNLSTMDLVALSGSHSIGKARCFSIVFRLYNQSGSGQPDPTIDPEYCEELDRLCPSGGDEEVVGSLDGTPERFDNRYYKDLVRGRGFLNSDQTLFTSDETRRYVRIFGRSQRKFFRAFAEGMVRLGDLRSGRPGEVRTDCRVVNGRGPVVLSRTK
ncbi:hypothetical protein OROGR_017272 [Orobanche gracilis]